MVRRGSVVWAILPDPNGKPIYDEHGELKEHPALVLSSNSDIATGRDIVAAAISTSFDRNNKPSHWFIMDSQLGGHPGTNLTRPCVAKADWLVRIEQKSIRKISPGICGRIASSVLNWLDSQNK